MLIAATFAFLALQQCAMALPTNDESDESDNTIRENIAPPSWVKIVSVPPHILKVRLGSRVEIKCAAIGIPEATVRWMRGDSPIYMSGDNEQEEYRLLDGGTFLAGQMGRYIFHRFLLRDEGVYTCAAFSGDAVVKSYPVKIVVMRDCQSEEINPFAFNDDLRPPEIIRWTSTMMGMMNSSILIRCFVLGNPKPSVYWMDQSGKTYLTYEDGVLENGDLLIRNLTWEQMGNFKCIAENSKGIDITSTFVYPLLPENQVKKGGHSGLAQHVMKSLMEVKPEQAYSVLTLTEN